MLQARLNSEGHAVGGCRNGSP